MYKNFNCKAMSTNHSNVKRFKIHTVAILIMVG